MLGWATSEDMPTLSGCWITIDEPDKASKEDGSIFFWVRELDEAGIPQGAPRAYRVPFTEQAAEEAQAALGKMEEGDVMNGTLSNNAMREKDKEAQREGDYEGTDRMGGDDGFRPMFELRRYPTYPAIES